MNDLKTFAEVLFYLKFCVEFSLTSLGTLKYD